MRFAPGRFFSQLGSASSVSAVPKCRRGAWREARAAAAIDAAAHGGHAVRGLTRKPVQHHPEIGLPFIDPTVADGLPVRRLFATRHGQKLKGYVVRGIPRLVSVELNGGPPVQVPVVRRKRRAEQTGTEHGVDDSGVDVRTPGHLRMRWHRFPAPDATVCEALHGEDGPQIVKAVAKQDHVTHAEA